jgi:Mn2+/Fe2+ NRAMP family transporter
VLNALLLLPLLIFMFIIARDRSLMGEFTAGRSESAIYLVTMALIAICVGALLILS